MKISTITTIGNSIYYLCSVRCSISEITTSEGLKIYDNAPFFSFDKETFNNFELNATDEILKHETLTELSSDQCNPLVNFFKTFCMFYIYSQIKHDEEFRMALTIFFEAFYGKDPVNGENIITVDNCLEMLFAPIEKILNEKDLFCQLVIVEEVGDRIICKLNNSYKNSNYENSSRERIYLNIETHKETVDFFMNFNDLYLSKFFEAGLLNFVENLKDDEDFKRLLDSNCNLSKKFDSELFDLYMKIYQNSQDGNEDLCGERKEERIELFKIASRKCFLKYVYYLIIRDFKSKTPKHLTELKLKVMAKHFFCLFEKKSIFPTCSTKDKLIVPLLVNQFDKIFEGRNLSKKTIDSLVLRNFEISFN